MTTVQTIYGDETGFSGNNLLDAPQPYFAYCTIAVSPERAENLVKQARKDFRLDGPELKGQKLVRHSRGRKAITWLISQCAADAKISIYEKRYTLAGKFFEYIFEPVIANRSSFFYEIGFHRFIANLLYLEVFVKDMHAEQTLTKFQELMVSRDASRLRELTSSVGRDPDISLSLSQILTFATIHKDIIAAELSGLAGADPVGKWILDVTTDALYNQLCEWGQRFDSLEVYYDPSKPVYAVQDILFDRMVGRTQTAYAGDRPLTFNLAKPIQAADSKIVHGVQLADLLATAAAFSYKAPYESISTSWREQLSSSVGTRLVLPHVQMIDFKNPETYVNAGVLWLLVERSMKGQDIFTGLPSFVELCLHQHQNDRELKEFLDRSA